MIDNYWRNGDVGLGYGAINMRYVSCSSNSPSLFSCSYIANSYNCHRYEDVGVQCNGKSCLLGTIYN